MCNSAELSCRKQSCLFSLCYRLSFPPGTGFSADANRGVTCSSIFHTRPDKAISLCDFYRKKCFSEALV